jgi:amino acid adenylation domain-containing protein
MNRIAVHDTPNDDSRGASGIDRPATGRGMGSMSDGMPSAEWNETQRDYPTALLHEVVAARMASDPSATAIRFRDEVVTYGELDRRIDELARYLVTQGVTRDTLVAMCMDRSIEMVVGVHAVMRAGGAYVPIDPEYPDERIDRVLEDLDGPIMLTQRRFAARLARTAARVVPIDVPLDLPASLSNVALPRVSPDDLAYVVYTSGSTGRPKGAMNTHRGIANRIYWQQEHFGLTPADTLIQKTPYTFDVSLWEFFWPFMYGAQLVIAEPGGHRDSAYLCETIIRHGVTIIHFVPSMLRLFLDDPRASACTSLRSVFSGGEVLPRALHDRFFGLLPSRLHNLYGPAEAANDVTFWDCDPASPLPFVPIGKPMANTQLHILDEAMRPIPVGDIGELYLGGVNVGRGYVKRPELTAERFLPDPFRPGGTLYRTGDLARYLPDGNVEFLGRGDFQVKVRGFRVELGEIEAILESAPGVRGAVVVVHERPGGDQELVAYVAHPDGAGLATDGLRTRLSDRVPEYMVPSRIIGLERIPLNTNGKVDRAALPAPIRTRPVLETPYVAPRTPMQRYVADAWSVILDVDRVGIHDRFFELGGTSLDAARFVNQMQLALGETIFVITLFGAPSAAEYAALLEQRFPASVARLVGGRAPEAVGAAVSGPAEAPATSAERVDRRASLARLRDRRTAARTLDRE